MIRLPRCFLLACLICALLLPACAPPAPSVPEGEVIREITVLYTNDEHGWMAGHAAGDSAAAMLGLWRQQEAVDDGNVLILSGGDMWVGPALSTWYEGAGMVEVMNAMGYHAAAIGNHEFDFGVDVLRERIAEAEFALLGANIYDTTTGQRADFALPYVIEEVNGVAVGIIGLTATDTPAKTRPSNVANLEFRPYADVLREVVPQVRAEGAELLIVLAHVSSEELRELAPTAAELGIALLCGGHSHRRVATTVAGIPLVEAGASFIHYGRVQLSFDVQSGEVVQSDVVLVPNANGLPDPEVEALVTGWQQQLDADLMHVIGYLNAPLRRGEPALYNMVMDAWLSVYPADIAISNAGGFRQDLPAGEITLADVVGVLPFDNVLVDVKVTGAQVMEALRGRRNLALGGITTRGRLALSDGTLLDPDATYNVLVNDFMYEGGDGFRFSDYDPHAYNTEIDWRLPVIEWISTKETSPDNPLDNYLDTTQR